jgi:hypothetical protein
MLVGLLPLVMAPDQGHALASLACYQGYVSDQLVLVTVAVCSGELMIVVLFILPSYKTHRY